MAARSARARSPDTRGPETLGSLLSQSRELDTPAGQVSQQLWETAVGERIAARCRPERVSKAVLWVQVPSSTWAQELSLHADTIASRLREAGLEVNSLRFRVVAQGGTPAVTPRRPVQARRAALPAPLQQRLAQVDDPELRAAIADAAALTLGRRGRSR